MAARKYLDTRLAPEQRAADLVARLTLDEKIAQLVHEAPGVPRLNIPKYNWWNECLHGVGRAGMATVFPQAIAMAASFDEPLMRTVANAIADEARAKHHQALRQNNRIQYFGLTFWSPNINIFRDPRWGRGHETYGEDPYLTARMGVAFVKGLQGTNPRYLKTAACAKHYAVHSGPESLRHGFDARVNQRDLRETYLPAFEALVREAKVESVMGAYNRTNGEPCNASPTLLRDILRNEWGFNGHVVSDCGAICDIYKHHNTRISPAQAAALSVRNGCDLNCGEGYKSLPLAIDLGLITGEEITQAVTRLFTTRFRLGMFDPESKVPYARTKPSVVNCQRHRDLARTIAGESIVLLKNEKNLLPLKKDINKILLVGPNAMSQTVLLGNYNGISKQNVTIAEGILEAVSAGSQVFCLKGTNLTGEPLGGWHHGLDHAINEARASDVVIACFGLSPEFEGEEGESAETKGGDRPHIGLPGKQEEALKKLYETGTPMVLVLTGGSPIASAWAKKHIPAILMAWYPGEEGGRAVADIIFGERNPSGRLPITFYASLGQVPPFKSYAMKGRTYRFMKEAPLWRFGYGLSYTSFSYTGLALDKKTIGPRETVRASVWVKNTGKRAGSEVVQLYVKDLQASVPVPLVHLEGFTRLFLKPGEKKRVAFTIRPEQLAAYDNAGRPFVEPGTFSVSIGNCQPADPAFVGTQALFSVQKY